MTELDAEEWSPAETDTAAEVACAADESVADASIPPLLTLAAWTVVAPPPAAVFQGSSKLNQIFVLEASPEAVAAADVPAARQVLAKVIPRYGRKVNSVRAGRISIVFGIEGREGEQRFLVLFFSRMNSD